MFLSAMPVRSCLKSCLLLLCQRSQSAFRSALKHSTLSWHFSTSTGIYGETEKTTATGAFGGHHIRLQVTGGLQPQGSGWCGSFGGEGCIREMWHGHRSLSPILPLKSWESFFVELVWRTDKRYPTNPISTKSFYFEKIVHHYFHSPVSYINSSLVCKIILPKNVFLETKTSCVAKTLY